MLKPSFRVLHFHFKDKTVVRPSYIYNGNSCTDKTASLYRVTPTLGEALYVLVGHLKNAVGLKQWLRIYWNLNFCRLLQMSKMVWCDLLHSYQLFWWYSDIISYEIIFAVFSVSPEGCKLHIWSQSKLSDVNLESITIRQGGDWWATFSVALWETVGNAVRNSSWPSAEFVRR